MSLRWRARGGALLCAAKHDAMEDDTYIDDNLHYQLSVELKVVIPQADEHESGVWHWVNAAPPPSDAAQLAAEKLLSLKDNWDSYGAPIISKIAVDAALQLRNVLATVPAFVPMSNGGVQLEWHSQGFDVELEIQPNGRLAHPDVAPSPKAKFFANSLRRHCLAPGKAHLPETCGCTICHCAKLLEHWGVAHPEDAPEDSPNSQRCPNSNRGGVGVGTQCGYEKGHDEPCFFIPDAEDAPGGPWEIGSTMDQDEFMVKSKIGFIGPFTWEKAVAYCDALNRVERLKGEGETDG